MKKNLIATLLTSLIFLFFFGLNYLSIHATEKELRGYMTILAYFALGVIVAATWKIIRSLID